MNQVVISIPVTKLRPSAANPRKAMEDGALKELTESVREKGVIEPLIVRTKVGDTVYEIIAGHRRWKSAKAAGLTELPCLVRELGDDEALELAIIDNLQREDVHPLEEAEGYWRLIKAGQEAATVGRKIGKSESYVYDRLKLLELAPVARKGFLEGKMTASHAVLIARLQPKDQSELLNEAFPPYDDSMPSVRSIKRRIDLDFLRKLSAAPWKKDDATLYPKAGPCTTCPKMMMVGKEPTCTDRECFGTKFNLLIERKRKKLRELGEFVEVSREYTNTKGVLSPYYWRPAKKGEKNRKPALVVQGKDAGEVLHVVLTRERERTVDRSWERQQQAEKRRVTLENRYRAELFKASIAKTPGKFSQRDEELLKGALSDHVQPGVLVQALGLKPKKGSRLSPEKLLAIEFGTARPAGRIRFLRALAVAGDLKYQPWWKREPKHLLLLARMARVRPGPIRTRVRRALRVKKRVQTSGPGKGRRR